MSMSATLPADVRERLAAYCADLDRRCPAKLEGLYVVGSIALGDFQARLSNIDVVAVSASPWSSEPLDQAHQAQKRLDLDRRSSAAYVTWEQLAADPGPLGDDLANPFTWRILRDDAMVERGPDYPEIWCDDEAVAGWARRQLRERWAPWVASARRRPTSLIRRRSAADRVLGAAQLFHASRGQVRSKTAAGRATIAELGPLRDRILRDATGYREGSRTSMYWGPVERRRHALQLVSDVVSRVAH